MTLPNPAVVDLPTDPNAVHVERMTKVATEGLSLGTPAIPGAKPDAAPQKPSNVLQIPEQFQRESVEDTLAALLESYTQLQGEFTKVKQGKQTAEAKPGKAKSTEGGLRLNTEETPAAPAAPQMLKPEEWEALFATGHDGTLPEETIERLKAIGVPESVINRVTGALQNEYKGIVAEAATLVGGQDKLDEIIEWANENIPHNERVAIDRQLTMPGWQMVLLGVQARMQREIQATGSGNQQAVEARAEAARTAGGVQVNLPAPVSGTPMVKLFRSVEEMVAAQSDPRYRNDPAYRDDVIARVAASTKAGYLKSSFRIGSSERMHTR